MKKNNNSEYLDFVETKFEDCFFDKGYFKEEPVNITSQIDPTVDFIGSKISPLKKYIVTNNIPNKGVYLIQNSMKLNSLHYLKTAIPQKFGCYYKCMGILAKPDLNDVVFNTFDYFINPNYLNIPTENIRIRICSQDRDLMNAIHQIDDNIVREVDTVDLKHYRHKYGMSEQNITGRDFNIAIRKEGTSDFINCATFVLMEKQEQPIAVDMGIGNCSLSMCKYGYNSTVESSRMADIVDIDCIEKSKFTDALIAVSILLKEDIMSHQSKHFKKKFRQYFNSMMYWNEKFGYTIDEIVEMIINFLKLEYNASFENNRDSWVKILKR